MHITESKSMFHATPIHPNRRAQRPRRMLSHLVLVLAPSFLLGACSVAGPRHSPLPHDGPTMAEIYKRHMEEESPQRDDRPRRGADDDIGRDTRSDPTVNRFQRLPNPDLEMHVFAHLAAGKYPVPGYVTVFPMYETVQYAMPGEVPPRMTRHADAGAN